MTKKVSRPQMPKRRNFVKKHMDTFQKPQTHRDRTKYDRYEDYLKDQLNDYVTGEWDDLDEGEQAETKKKFVAAIKGDEYDPDLKKEWEDYQWWQDRPNPFDRVFHADQSDDGYEDDYDY